MSQEIKAEAKNEALAIMQEYFPNGGRDWDSVSLLFDAIVERKIPHLGLKNKPQDQVCNNCFSDAGPCTGDCAISDVNQKYEDFASAAEPLMKYLAENHNPHAVAIINATGAEVLTGELTHNTEKFLVD